ncbi:hypothetical protein FKM82_025062 [Ascaphus truei]
MYPDITKVALSIVTVCSSNCYEHCPQMITNRKVLHCSCTAGAVGNGEFRKLPPLGTYLLPRSSFSAKCCCDISWRLIAMATSRSGVI